ncbi:hypothetical protein LO772_26390 [Yinghuangia sp. ASG 101]|uniref:hypothetical protein n=1 Tax=Yinghuangia sp. ASG 101 TaxID=2896848 RepID=UPI001E337D47|nr:hypothetical protein [Yinghuangia sp. ASG 101]UGQ10364.1 hypothetical protein LO772_26390 [Yinghuangia sp. ASG 101]
MSTWGWKCQHPSCSANRGRDRQRYRTAHAAAVAARAHTSATGHATTVVEFR